MIHQTSGILTYHLAHWLRIELWKEHLNMMTVAANAELADGVASAVHWLNLPPNAKVRHYRHEEDGDQHLPSPIIGRPLELAIYDSIIDPA